MDAPTSRWLDLLGARVHWVDLGGPERPEALLVCVHGLGGGTVNWEALAPLLTGRSRVVALDLVGFGRTEPGSRGADVLANADLVAAFVARLAAQQPDLPVVLVGNSMGGLVAAMAVERLVTPVAGLVLLDPALGHPGRRMPGLNAWAGLAIYGAAPVSTAVGWGRRRLRTPEQLVADTLRLCTGDPSRISAEVVARHVELARTRVSRPELDALFGEAARSVVLRTAGRRELDDVYDGLRLPVVLVHGTRDRLVPYAAAVRAARRHPGWLVVTGVGLGHVPQLEDPSLVARAMAPLLDRVGTPAR